MDGKLGWSRLFAWGRARAQPQEPDAADVGTAFGMEISLQFEPTQAAEDADEDEHSRRGAPAAAERQRKDRGPA
jgi:hypothetical protein